VILHHQQERWRERNEIAAQEIQEDNKKTCVAMDNDIKAMYLQENQLDVAYKKIFAIPIERRLSMIRTSKIEWIKRTRTLIKIGISNSKKKTTRDNHSMREYCITAKSEEKPKQKVNGTTLQDIQKKIRIAISKKRKENTRPP
jgi:ribosomal protein L7/L12